MLTGMKNKAYTEDNRVKVTIPLIRKETERSKLNNNMAFLRSETVIVKNKVARLTFFPIVFDRIKKPLLRKLLVKNNASAKLGRHKYNNESTR
jgi:hypothetical protein